MTESYNSQIESNDDKMEAVLLKFLQENNYSATELKQSYFLLCGVSENDASERVILLKGEMEKMVNDHYPLNRFVRMITGIENWEDSVSIFDSFVSEMNISDKEKTMLSSIVNRNRSGELECHVDGQLLVSFLISKSISSEGAAFALKEKLSEVLFPIDYLNLKKGRLSFWFEEKDV